MKNLLFFCLISLSLFAKPFLGMGYEHFFLENFLEKSEVLVDIKDRSEKEAIAFIFHQGERQQLVYPLVDYDSGHCQFTWGAEVYHIDFLNGVYFKEGSQILRKVWGLREILKERGGQTKLYFLDEEGIKNQEERVIFLTLDGDKWHKLNIMGQKNSVLSLENYPFKTEEKEPQVLFLPALLNEGQKFIFINSGAVKKFLLFDTLYEKKN